MGNTHNCFYLNINIVSTFHPGEIHMDISNKKLNLVLSGGGVKGIAFLGALEVSQKRGYDFENIAGVSAGALVGACVAAGYKADELKKIMDEFDFAKMDTKNIPKKVPVVAEFLEFSRKYGMYGLRSVEHFLRERSETYRFTETDRDGDFTGYRGDVLKSIVKFSKEGYFLDGDYLEEWVYKVLAKKGIRTFGDLRGKYADAINPRGYSIRMTAVDANRGKMVILPDDVFFYGINPDALEVAKAVRMSTSVPFAFKPVVMKKKEGKTEKTYHLVDGGVFDSFPFWLIDSSKFRDTVGFRLVDSSKKLINLGSPLTVLKYIISAVHDIGIPKIDKKLEHVALIETSKISFLDFNLSEAEKQYLYSAGKMPAQLLFDKLENRIPPGMLWRLRPYMGPYIRPYMRRFYTGPYIGPYIGPFGPFFRGSGRR